MERLPRRANFQRAKTLWEIGLQIAADPRIPYGGPRDMMVAVGNGSGDSFRPWLRLATGSPILAEAVARGEVELAFVNPSGLLTQAYRGTGLFRQPLPLRAVAVYPSWDRFVVMAHPRLGLRSLAELKERKLAVRLSIREDPTHSTRVLTDQLFAEYGFSLAEVEAWGGSFQLNGPPFDQRRIDAIHARAVDLVLDEGVHTWLEDALAVGYQPLPFDEPQLQALERIGWRRVVLPAGRVAGLRDDYTCLDYAGWPLYTRADLADDDVERICAALAERADEIPWEDSFSGIEQLAGGSEATPLDVPLHPAAERWFARQAGQPANQFVEQALRRKGIGTLDWYRRDAPTT